MLLPVQAITIALQYSTSYLANLAIYNRKEDYFIIHSPILQVLTLKTEGMENLRILLFYTIIQTLLSPKY